MSNRVLIIGGGASGMAAAITASKTCDVTIIEKNDRLGKKLLLTGNGRCNFGNLSIPSNAYNNMSFVSEVIARSKEDANKLIEEIGVVSYADKEGRIYPVSESATSVVDCLRYACERENITVMTGKTAESVFKRDNGFAVTLNDGTLLIGDKVIIAAGGKSYTQSYNVDKLVESRNFIPIHPGLTGVKVNPVVKALSGLRIKSKVSLMKNGVTVYKEKGEVQFKDNYISGIVVMNASSIVARDYENISQYTLRLNILPTITKTELVPMLQDRLDRFGAQRMLKGLFHSRVVEEIKRRAIELGYNDITSIASIIRHFDFSVVGLNGYDTAQITVGGIDTHALKANLEFRKTEGLFACGEAVDVDGLCGGYNLHWAFTSGIVAGKLEAM